MRDLSHKPTVSYRDQYTLGGLLVYAAVVPAVITVLSAPQLAVAFVGGVFTALLLNRLRGRAGGTALGSDTDTDPGTRSDPRTSADTGADSAQTAKR
ncbi:MAG: hypothetical protein J07HX5_00157 [halophilic archaeon J07HX5]|jgi:hypothetical protein|nr:MAG: hypothetical protein J07HX5_00157 [halophilic archaeon J07HX5]